MERASVAIIGAGNVATHLAMAIDAVADVLYVCSRNLAHASALAARLRGARAIDDVASLPDNCDYYIIAVNDDSIPGVSASIPETSALVMHTSGSVPMSVLSRHRHHGVLYPLQTFSAATPVDVSRVPFFIEASDAGSMHAAESLASQLSTAVYRADSAQRAALHVAAVFGCNFFNHLLEISQRLLADNGYDLQVLRPLLEVTLAKAMEIGPHKAQTGPAVRGDSGTMQRHLALLDPAQAEIYSLLSDSIIRSRSIKP